MEVRHRRFSAKVRTGCKTCKIRRIKCDETKPSCHRCTSTGRSCDGYTPTIAMQPSSSSSQNPTAEKQALYMFRTKIALLLSSSFDVDFWTYDLLQTAESYKTVQHAVAALAAAYQTCILSDKTSHTEGQFVLTQYNKSINSLRQYLSKTKFRSTNQQVVVLITTLLLVCLCAVQGHRSEACSHLRSGLALLHEWGLGTVKDKKASSSPALRFLVAIFTQLDTQARMMIEAIGPRPWSSHHVLLDSWGSGHLQPITDAFTQLEMLHNEGVQMGDNSNTIEYQQQLSTWDASFKKFLANTDGTSTSNSIRILQIRRLLAGVSWESISELDITSYYTDILRLATLIIQESGFQKGKMSFIPAGGLIEALYFVATRCEDRGIRVQAIGLLEQYPFIEGRCDYTENAEDIIEAVLAGDFNEAQYHTILVSCLEKLYQRTGKVNLLEEAIGNAEMVTKLTPKDDLNRPEVRVFFIVYARSIDRVQQWLDYV